MAPSLGYVVTFTSASLLTIPGTLHGLGSADLLYQLYDAATPEAAIEPGSFQCGPCDGDGNRDVYDPAKRTAPVVSCRDGYGPCLPHAPAPAGTGDRRDGARPRRYADRDGES